MLIRIIHSLNITMDFKGTQKFPGSFIKNFDTSWDQTYSVSYILCRVV